MLSSLYRRLSKWAHGQYMLSGVAVASFLESILIPIPIEALLVPLSQVRRDKVWWIATVATLGCIVGALIAYALGLWLFAQYEQSILGWFGDPQGFSAIQTRMHEEGFWFIVLAGIAPIPLQLAMVAAGVSGYPIGLYILAIALSRMIRYFGIAWLVLRFGDQTEALLRKHQYKAVLGLSSVFILIWMGQSYLL